MWAAVRLGCGLRHLDEQGDRALVLLLLQHAYGALEVAAHLGADAHLLADGEAARVADRDRRADASFRMSCTRQTSAAATTMNARQRIAAARSGLHCAIASLTSPMAAGPSECASGCVSEPCCLGAGSGCAPALRIRASALAVASAGDRRARRGLDDPLARGAAERSAPDTHSVSIDASSRCSLRTSRSGRASAPRAGRGSSRSRGCRPRTPSARGSSRAPRSPSLRRGTPPLRAPSS